MFGLALHTRLRIKATEREGERGKGEKRGLNKDTLLREVLRVSDTPLLWLAADEGDILKAHTHTRHTQKEG